MSTLLFVHNAYRLRAGEDAVAEATCAILAERGHRVVRYGVSSAEVLRLPLHRRAAAALQVPFSVTTYRALGRLAGRERPALALVQNVFPFLSPSVYYALAHRGVPVVQTVFNYRFVCPAGTLYMGGRTCERCVRSWTVPCVLHRCYRGSRAWSALYAAVVGFHRRAGTFARIPSLFVLAAEALRGPLVRGGLPGDRMVRIPNAFDARRYEPGTGSGRYLLYVGRLDPEKGVRTLVRAMAGVPGARLKVVGRGTEETVLRRMAAEGAGRVEFLGPVYGDAVATLLRDALAVVVPSEWPEVSPMIVLQAQAHARPVIATRAGGLPEMVADGTDGLLVAPGDADALAGAIRALSSDPARADVLGRAGRARVETDLSAARTYARLRDAVSRFVRPDIL